MATLQSLFAQHGEEQVVGGNTPFLLDDPTCVWVVAAGRVEVFSVAVSDGQFHGARRHFFTVEAGGVLFGFDSAACGLGRAVLAVGVIGTRVRRMAASFLDCLPVDEGGRAELARALEAWVSGLSEGVTREIVPRPRADVLVGAGEDVMLAPGCRLRSRGGVLWVRQSQGAPPLFIGIEEAFQGSALLPLASEAWLQSTTPSRLHTADTVSVLGQEVDWRAALASFYDTVFRCEVANIGLRTVDELNRLRDRAQSDARAQRSGLDSLLAVMRPGARQTTAPYDDDGLLSACQLVGNRLGITIRPPRRQEHAVGLDPLREIARASGFRVRGVVLKGEWWKADNGPLLGATEADLRPVAIVPEAAGYQIRDPRTGERTPVTAESAGRLAARAHVFYRSFPDAKLGPWALFRFGMAGRSAGLALLVSTGLAAGLLGLVPPYFTGWLVDSVIPEAARSQLVQLALILLVISIAGALFQLVRGLAALRVEMVLGTAIQPALWDRLLRLPVTFFRRYTAGDLSQRVGGIDLIRQTVSGAVTSSLLGSVFSLFQLCFMLYYSWKLALLGLGLVLVVLVAVAGTGLLRIRFQRDVSGLEGKVAGLVLQLLSGIAKLRVTGGESRAFAEWARQFGEQRRLAYRAGLVQRVMEVFTAVFPVLCAMALFWGMVSATSAAASAGDETMSAGGFVAFNAAFGTFLGSALQMASAAMSLLAVVPTFERAKPILSEPLEADERKVDPGELNGAIEVSHLCFRYHDDGPLILGDVSLQAKPGEFVAVVGPSGSGKSTLLRIMLGLELPASGSVFYDGIDLGTLDGQKLRRRIGVVMQGGQVRAGSIFSNIVGSTLLTLDDAWEAARMAGFDEDVRQMPMGMHSVLPHGGTTLSGGQRQRLIIARAIVSRPRVIFFDEATSALDNRTQAVVAESLRQLQATRVVIAHRLSTIVGADRIYVMQAGRVVQAGRYHELLAEEGLFAELMRRQVA